MHFGVTLLFPSSLLASERFGFLFPFPIQISLCYFCFHGPVLLFTLYNATIHHFIYNLFQGHPREQAFPGFLKVPLSVMTFLGLKTHMVTVNGSVSNKNKKDFRSFAMMMKALHQAAKNHTKTIKKN